MLHLISVGSGWVLLKVFSVGVPCCDHALYMCLSHVDVPEGVLAGQLGKSAGLYEHAACGVWVCCSPVGSPAPVLSSLLARTAQASRVGRPHDGCMPDY